MINNFSRLKKQDIYSSQIIEEEEENYEFLTRRAHNFLTLQPKNGTQASLSQSCSTHMEDDDLKEFKMLGKFKTFVDLKRDQKLKVETKSMLQFSESMNKMQDSSNSLTSIESMFIQNQLEDFEDEELSYEFKTLEYIGQGCHAIVKKVQDIVTNEILAAKITRINDDEIAIAITNEFEILRKLDHAYILKAYRIFKNPSKSIMTIITEYIDCKDLSVYLIKNSKSITEKIATIILKKLLIAVEYLHNNFICHRDLSPKNILLSDDLLIFKLVDFGVSKIFNVAKQPIDMITPTGIPTYRAPEILKGNKFDEKVDEWTCGHIFYEILKRKHITSKKLYKLIKEKELLDNLKEFSPEIKEIIEGLLELSPKKRMIARDCLKNPLFSGL